MSASPPPVGEPRSAQVAAGGSGSVGELLVLRHVVKSWRTGDPRAPAIASVLRGVSLAVHASETVAVVAAPGVGGSTLLLVAAGIARPDWGGGSVRHVKVGRGAMAVHLVPTEPALPGSATPRELLLQRAWRTGCGNRPAMEAERQLRHRILASVANVPLRRLPPYFAWLTALAAARMEPGVVLVDRPPDDARTRGLAVEPALAVAERGRVELRAELHLVREPSSAPPGARVVQLRDGRVVGQGTGW